MLCNKKLLLAAVLLATSFSAMAKEVVDIAGRSVTIPDKVERIVLGEGRMIYALSILQANPIKNVVAWRSDLLMNDPDTAKKLTDTFPATKKIPDLGDPYASDVNLESVIKLKPDVYLLNIGNLLKARESGLLTKLAKAKIPTVFIDFRQFPTENTVPSMLILGEVVNEQTRALKFINYYRQQMALVKNRLLKLKDADKPLVFMENAAGLTPDKCCTTYGQQNFGKFVALAGGNNWGSRVSNGFKVKANPEVIFSEPFDVIIGTGANWKGAYKGAETVSLGYFANPKEVQSEIKNLANRKGWSELKAVKNKRFYSIYHQFYNSPYHFIAVQVLAKWLHPDIFADVDVEKNYQEFYKEFLPINFSGMFWAQLK